MMKTCVLFLLLYCAIANSLNCTVDNHRKKLQIEWAEIVCTNVSTSLLLAGQYFTQTPYPQDVIITNSAIPIIPNYSSLLNMWTIRRLVMRNVGIKYITPGAFRKMGYLEELDLSNNNIARLEEGTFGGLVNLTRLNLKHNNITEIGEHTFEGLLQLEALDISGNPIEVFDKVRFVKNVDIKTDK